MGFKDNLLGPLPPGNGLYTRQSLSTDKDASRTPTNPPHHPSYKPDLDQPSAQQLPSVDQCICHLKLLTARANLQEDISTSESLFGLSDSLTERLSDRNKQEVLPKIREKRWQVYVFRAVERCRVLWEREDLSSHGHFDLITEKGKVINWGPDRAPPLGTICSCDGRSSINEIPNVLMVLHSSMQNPRAFFEDCIRQEKMDVWATGLPWALINTCIDNSSSTMSNFEQMTGFALDNLHDPSTAKTDAFLDDPKRPFEHGRGYVDRSFTTTCAQCNFTTNHEILKLQKFRRDLQALLKDDVPMPGTSLSQEGRPDKALNPDLRRHEMFFPNRIIIGGLKTLLINATDNIQVGKSTVTNIRDAFDRAIRDASLV
ncbi:hypothetical protein POJ06DRAFT_258557 [Lipomyces tetrasporus]|uniref:Uncharacterized protein n=1 Tax=Lipomyces tetrasporus TaxID=54092 RepID=A0AAD7VPR9_9ASCO|nr:uncharacterized protein POJ06DRAFT_258557 [Lipomyces tetrasporus]KAJ8098107.1 hypothetical protein POJ06DRAFT_258557 [Lipomyces tetrasporus]